jgi:hypothetical protein
MAWHGIAWRTLLRLITHSIPAAQCHTLSLPRRCPTAQAFAEAQAKMAKGAEGGLDELKRKHAQEISELVQTTNKKCAVGVAAHAVARR